MNKQGLVWFLAAMLGTAVGAQELKTGDSAGRRKRMAGDR